jgi:DNA processing protein
VNTTKLHYVIALTLLKGVGPRTAKMLISEYGEAEDFFYEKKLNKKSFSGFSKDKIRTSDRTKALLRAEKEINFVLKHDVRLLYYKNKDFPQRLKGCVDAPIIMYAKGNFETNPVRSVAVVGTRKITDYGKSVTESFIKDLSNHNVQVVSGMAYGVDIFAHKACVRSNVPTIGVLGHGLDRIYPAAHRDTASKMIKHNGGLLTEFMTETNPDRENFPQRNRIVAGMTDATVVIESGEKGGSLITANLANDYSRDVFAVPGSVSSKYSIGCNQLIQDNKAHLVTSANDLVEIMGWNHQEQVAVQRQLFNDLLPEESALAKIIKNEAMSIDVISAKLKQPVSKVSSLLLGMEIKGLVQAKPGSKFILS